MSQVFSRRTFLKTTGTVALAAAAAATLSACGGGGGSTPSSAPTTFGNIELQDLTHKRLYTVDSNHNITGYCLTYVMTVKNNGSTPVTLTCSAKIDNSTVQYIRIVQADTHHTVKSLDVKDGETVTYRINYNVSKDTYDNWTGGNHTSEFTLINGDKKIVYSVDSAFNGTRGEIENV